MIAETIAPETTETMPHAPAPPPAMILMQMMDGIKVTQLIHAAAKLGIADLLKDGPKSSTEMAAAVGVSPQPSTGCCGPWRGSASSARARRAIST